MDKRIESLKGSLIVSCQALDYEPLHSSFIMGRMAKAADMGGAKGIRANTVEDIEEIRKNVNLPIIAIIKRDYPDSEIYITPTMKEIDELVAIHPEIIALDATDRIRPNNLTLDEFYHTIRAKYPSLTLMADCSTLEECIHADELGFDFIGTTMIGYTPKSKGLKIAEDDFALLKEIIKSVKHPVIAEGNIDSPEKARRVLEIGAFATVVGSSITRPQLITKKYSDAIKGL